MCKRVMFAGLSVDMIQLRDVLEMPQYFFLIAVFVHFATFAFYEINSVFSSQQ